MATWTNVPDSNLEPGDPIRSVDIIAIKDNVTALAEGASGAPEIYQKATQFSANAQRFTSNGTFTIPTGVVRLKIMVIGGGGGGRGGTNGGAGGNSSVASGTQSITTITANGGGGGTNAAGGAGGTATNGDINISGGAGPFVGSCNPAGGGAAGGAPGTSTGSSTGFFGGSGGFNSAGTGFGNGGGSLAGGAGGGAGVALKWLSVTGGTLTITVGAAGTAGSGAYAGSAGLVLIEW